METYKFIGNKDQLYETDFKENANCPESEKTGSGPGSCGGATGKSTPDKIPNTDKSKITPSTKSIINNNTKWKIGQRITYSMTYKHGEGQYAVTRTDQFTGKIAGFKVDNDNIIVEVESKFGRKEDVPISKVYKYMKPVAYGTGKPRGRGYRGT